MEFILTAMFTAMFLGWFALGIIAALASPQGRPFYVAIMLGPIGFLLND